MGGIGIRVPPVRMGLKAALVLLIAVSVTVGCDSGGGSSDPTNASPQAVFSVSTDNGFAPLPVTFDASGSTDSDGTVTRYDWTFGDGTTGSGSNIQHTYQTAGTYTTELIVTDDNGLTNTQSHDITVAAASSQVSFKVFTDSGSGSTAESTVEVYPYSSILSSPAYVTTTSNGDTLDDIGFFSLPPELIDDSELYLIVITGGLDWDADGDGIKDGSSTVFTGTLHGVFTSTQIRNDLNVTFLTEAIYQRLAYMLSAEYAVSAIIDEMNLRSEIVLAEDVDGDGDQDADDLVLWNPAEYNSKLRQDISAWQPLIAQIRNGENSCVNAYIMTNEFLGFSQASDAQIIGSENTPGANDVVLKENISYVVYDDAMSFQSFLQTVDITDPANPSIIGRSVDLNSLCHPLKNITVDGNVAYLNPGFAWIGSSCLYSAAGVHLIDIHDPAQISYINSISPIEDAFWYGYPSANTAVLNSIAYTVFSENPSDLLIVDTGSPDQSIEILSSLVLPDRIERIEVDDDVVLVANHKAGLQIIDVSTPATPVILQTIDIPGTAFDVEIENQLAGILSYSDDQEQVFLSLLDIQDRLTPVILSVVLLPEPIETLDSKACDMGIAIHNQFVYIHGYINGCNDLLIVDTRDPTRPMPFAVADTKGDINGIDVADGIICVAGSEGLRVLLALAYTVP